MKKWLMVCLLIPSLLYALPIEVPAKYYDTLVAYCNQYGVPIYYTSRLIAYESGWNAKHINKNTNGTTDKGLMQLNWREAGGSYGLGFLHAYRYHALTVLA